MKPPHSRHRMLLWTWFIAGSAGAIAGTPAQGYAEPLSPSATASAAAAPAAPTLPATATSNPTEEAAAQPSAARPGEPRTLLEQHWAPEVAKLQASLQELRGKAGAAAGHDALQQRIKELEKRVGEIERHVTSGSKQLAELRASRRDRRDRTLQTLTSRWGAENLNTPAVRAELAQHARRSTRLKRAASVATDAGNAAAAKRARNLLDRENKRHANAMAELLGTSPSASGKP